MQHQRPGQRGNHRRIGMLERLGLAQFDFGGSGVTGVEQCLAEQEPRFSRVRLLLERRLELDDGRLAVVLLDVLIGGADQCLRRVRIATKQSSTDDQETTGIRGSAACLWGHGVVGLAEVQSECIELQWLRNPCCGRRPPC